MTHADETSFLPAAAVYMHKGESCGCAEGELVVTPACSERLRGYNLYWGSRAGERLANYTKITELNSPGPEEIRYRFPAALLVPEGAEALLLFPVLYNAERTQFSEAACCYAMEIGTEPFSVKEKKLFSFAVISDLHVTADPEHIHNRHLKNCFSRLLHLVPDAIGIMCTGDVTNHGYPEEWEQFSVLWTEARERGRPPMHFAVGNHDMHFYKYHGELGYRTSFEAQKAAFLRYTHTDSETFYHFSVIGGNYFIFLGPDRSVNSEENDCYVPISARQRAWLTAELEKAARQKALAFLFLHQPLRDTVSGSLCSVDPLVQSWHGVIEDAELRAVTDRFPGLVLFTGHTHWKFDSLQPFLPGNGKAASYINAASVAYLWTDQNGTVESGGSVPEPGSEGLIVEVYRHFILLRGYDFAAGRWSASAQFRLDIP